MCRQLSLLSLRYVRQELQHCLGAARQVSASIRGIETLFRAAQILLVIAVKLGPRVVYSNPLRRCACEWLMTFKAELRAGRQGSLLLLRLMLLLRLLLLLQLWLLLLLLLQRRRRSLCLVHCR